MKLANSFKIGLLIVFIFTIYLLFFHNNFTIRNYNNEQIIIDNDIIKPYICYGTIFNCKKFNYKTIDNINYNKNGEYYINYILEKDNIKINKKQKIIIRSNYD